MSVWKAELGGGSGEKVPSELDENGLSLFDILPEKPKQVT